MICGVILMGDLGTSLGVGFVMNEKEHWSDGYGVYGLLKKEWSEL